MNKNNSTRHYSDIQEKEVCRALGAIQQPNSGAGHWRKGDCILKDASLLLECKTSTSEKKSFSIKREFLEKNKQEALSSRLMNGCLCFDFGPGTDRYYVIDEKMMKFLVEKLKEDCGCFA
jgi:hypothetical protein